VTVWLCAVFGQANFTHDSEAKLYNPVDQIVNSDGGQYMLQTGLDWYWAMASPQVPWSLETRRFDPAALGCSTSRVMIDVGGHKQAQRPGIFKPECELPLYLFVLQTMSLYTL
jgi:hypothetical protein